MSLDNLWQAYQSGGYEAVQGVSPATAQVSFYLALLAFAHDDLAGAVMLAQEAARRQPESRVYAQAAIYLERARAQGKTNVYVNGDAFAAFIRGGGNVGLYAAASDTLRAIYQSYAALSLLDIGVGDGMALLPALTANLTRLDLIEPSAAMLARTTAALDARGIDYRAANTSLQAFMPQPAGQWDIVQATWSLQSVPPGERPAVFDWLRAHGQRTLIAEFDVPAMGDSFEPERVTTITGRYERGLAEYDTDGERAVAQAEHSVAQAEHSVAQGFLMPVLFGYFDRTAARTNWEGPLQGWVDALHAAGFTRVETHKLFAYFWADAYLIDAR